MPITVAEDELRWKELYERARKALLAGEFMAASHLFAYLEDSAPNDADRVLASEQRHLAEAWLARGAVLFQKPESAEPPMRPPKKQSGDVRTTEEIVSLYTNASIYGVGTGIWLAAVAQPTETATALLPIVGVTGVSVGAVAFLDSGRRMHYGVPQAIVSGMYIGFEEGVIWSVWNAERAGDHWQASTVSSVVWAFSTVGLVTGGVLGTSVPSTPGRASFVGSAALWSAALAGFGSGALNSDDSTRRNSAWLAAGIGLNAGTIAGLIVAGPIAPSAARVRFLDLGALGGGILGGALYLGAAGGTFEGRSASASIGVGVAGGLVAGWFVTAKMAPDYPRHDEAPPQAAMAPLVAEVHPSLIPANGGAMVGLSGQLF